MLTEDQWEHQESLDPEQGIGHNRELYTVWSEKSNFLKIAVDNDYFNSSYFLWLDIGAVRHKVSGRVSQSVSRDVVMSYSLSTNDQGSCHYSNYSFRLVPIYFLTEFQPHEADKPSA